MSKEHAKLQEAERKLAAVNHRIKYHTLNKPAMQEARRVASQYRDQHRDRHQDQGRAAADRALAERGLPSTARQGRAQFLGLASLARLNRRIKLESRIARLKALHRS